MTIRVCMNIYVSRTFQKSGQNSRKVPRNVGESQDPPQPDRDPDRKSPKKIPTDFFQKSILTDLLLGHVGTRYERIRDSFRTFSIGIR